MIKTTGFRVFCAIAFSYLTGIVAGLNFSMLLPNPNYDVSWYNVILSLIFAIVVPALIISKND